MRITVQIDVPGGELCISQEGRPCRWRTAIQGASWCDAWKEQNPNEFLKCASCLEACKRAERERAEIAQHPFDVSD